MKSTAASLLNACLILTLCASNCTADVVSDSLRVIEFKGPGESVAVDVPSGHVFQFSLFAPDKAASNSVVGVVTYADPTPYVYESKSDATVGRAYEGVFIGPAKVKLKNSSAGYARMQLYVTKLPPEIVSGILGSKRPTASLVIPANTFLTPLFRFNFEFASSRGTSPDNIDKFVHFLSVKSASGATYGINQSAGSYGYTTFSGFPSVSGGPYMWPQSPDVSSAVPKFGNDQFSSVGATDNFLGSGTATFSLPATGRKTDIAFYCYRLTPVKTLPTLGK